MPTLQVEQIKKTKTIPRAYMCGIDGVYRRLRHRKKNAGKQLSMNIFCGTSFYKRQEKNCKEKKKNDISLAIGENYINKMFLFF